MADPFTLGVIGLGASAAGGLLGAFGKYQEGQNQAQLYNYQSQIAKQNAFYQSKNAEYAAAAGEQQSMISGMRSGAQLHTNVARMGASNVAVGQGSSADVISSEKDLAKVDQTTIRNNAGRQVYGYQIAGTQATAQSDIYQMAGSNAQSAGSIGAMASLIGGVSSVSDKWLQGRSTGLWNSSAPYSG